MRIFSFIREGIELKPVEVEVSLMPGLPQFFVTGGADQAIKESLLRVRAALKSAKFELPTRLKVFFNLKPAYTRKKSDGLDLAFAVAYLLKTKQIHIDLEGAEKLYVYGELGLNGEVTVSDEVELMPPNLGDGAQLLMGQGSKPCFKSAQISHLSDIESPLLLADSLPGPPLPRPPAEDLYFDSKSARLLSVVATGEHSVLLAGPAGSGKSTLISAAHQVLRELSCDEQMDVARIAKVCGQTPQWRPLVSPHHTVPTMSMVGGGAPPFPGEITRAHRGVLLLDEFLEFQPAVREALREPVESHSITVSRKGIAQKFPADFLLFATTNLCPCGDFVPKMSGACKRSITQCRSYLEKLSGPVLDRFEILALTESQWQNGARVPLAEVREKVAKAQAFARDVRGQNRMNSRLRDDEVDKFVSPFVLREMYGPVDGSRRRSKALVRVARTIADLEGSTAVMPPHLEEARTWTSNSFQSLKHSFM
jgi:magnesium chelatase family protein